MSDPEPKLGREPTLELALPRLVAGKYRLGAEIGSGGMGRVHRAEHTGLGLIVAIKLLGEQLRDTAFYARFEREARLVARVRHDNVVLVTDFGLDDELGPYLVMELLSGETLASFLSHTPRLPEALAITIALQMLDGLAAAHAVHVIHRDLKPANVFLAGREDGTLRVKLLDFGIARDITANDSVTQEGGVVGTPLYMAPEQLEGAAPLDPRIDVYGTALVLYRMLTGELPFRDATGQKHSALRLNHPPRDPRELIPSLHASVVEVLLGALERDPARRPASAAAFRDALRHAAREVDPIFDTKAPSISLSLSTATALAKTQSQEIVDAASTERARPARSSLPPPSRLAPPALAVSPLAAPTLPAPIDSSESHTLQRVSASPVVAQATPSMPAVPSAPPSRAPASSEEDSLEVVVRSGQSRAPLVVGALLALGAVAGGYVAMRRWWGFEQTVRPPAEEEPAGAVVPLTGTPLVYAIVRYLPVEEVEATHRPLAHHLETVLARPVTLRVVEDYVDLAGELQSGEVSIAVLSAYAFVRAEARDPSLRLVATAIGDGGASYEGYVVVNADSDIEELTDLRQRTFCYVSTTSSSGYFYPRALFRQAGLDPDADFRATRLTGDHLASLRALHAGACDGAAVFGSILFRSSEFGLSPSQFRILARTERIPYDAYVLSSHLAENEAAAISRVLLDLAPDGASAREVFADRRSDLRGLVAAHAEDFAGVRALIEHVREDDGR